MTFVVVAAAVAFLAGPWLWALDCLECTERELSRQDKVVTLTSLVASAAAAMLAPMWIVAWVVSAFRKHLAEAQ